MEDNVLLIFWRKAATSLVWIRQNTQKGIFCGDPLEFYPWPNYFTRASEWLSWQTPRLGSPCQRVVLKVPHTHFHLVWSGSNESMVLHCAPVYLLDCNKIAFADHQSFFSLCRAFCNLLLLKLNWIVTIVNICPEYAKDTPKLSQTILCCCGIQFFLHFSTCLDFSHTILYYESEVLKDCGLPPPWPE